MAENTCEWREFNPSGDICKKCLEGLIDPTDWNGYVCKYVGILGHPGQCHRRDGLRVVTEMPVERITEETPINFWATNSFGIR